MSWCVENNDRAVEIMQIIINTQFWFEPYMLHIHDIVVMHVFFKEFFISLTKDTSNVQNRHVDLLSLCILFSGVITDRTTFLIHRIHTNVAFEKILMTDLEQLAWSKEHWDDALTRNKRNTFITLWFLGIQTWTFHVKMHSKDA